MKNKKMNQWFWRWHCIAGLISLPFIIMLSITGIIYLFKADYEKPRQQHITEVAVQGTPMSFQEQWELVKAKAPQQPNAMIVPRATYEATEFVSGRFSGKTSVFIDPYQGTISGKISPKDSLMFKVRKLHGELLLGTFGTTIIELIASWMVVLILTGLYIWWPSKGWKIKGFFIPRFTEGKKILYTDVHAITGFWFSILLLLILAGGFPWTNVFGNGFKWVQKQTHTGFPKAWHHHQLKEVPTAQMLTLDQIIEKTRDLNLSGEIQINFPKGSKGVFSVSNTNPADLASQQKIHLDPYTGIPITTLQWKDVGILMRGRMWVMAFHQGQFGLWNWVLVLITTIGLLVMSITAIVSYLMRKRKNDWSIPKMPHRFSVGYPVIGIVITLGILFPLFGASTLLLIGYSAITNRIQSSKTDIA